MLAGCFGSPPALGRPLAGVGSGSDGGTTAVLEGSTGDATDDGGSTGGSTSGVDGGGDGDATAADGTAAGSGETGAMTSSATGSTGAGEDAGSSDTGSTLELGCIDDDLGTALGDVALGSTTEAGDDYAPGCVDNSAADRVLLWQAPAAGTYTFSLADSYYDTVLALRTPDCAGVEFACNDDIAIGTNLQSEIADVVLDAGDTVVVAIDGFIGHDGDYVLTITQQ